MRGIEFYILRYVFHLLFLVPIIPLVLLFQYCDDHPQLAPYVWLIALFGVLYFAVAIYLAEKTAQHIVFENQPFFLALKSTMYDVRFHLAFLPVIGHWFIARESRRQGEHADDDTDQS